MKFLGKGSKEWKAKETGQGEKIVGRKKLMRIGTNIASGTS